MIVNLYNYNIMVLHPINIVSGLVQFTIIKYLKDLETPPLLIIWCTADIMSVSWVRVVEDAMTV